MAVTRSQRQLARSQPKIEKQNSLVREDGMEIRSKRDRIGFSSNVVVDEKKDESDGNKGNGAKYPIGKLLYPAISKRDREQGLSMSTEIFMVSSILLALPLCLRLTVYFDLDNGIDETLGVDMSLAGLLLLLENTVGMDPYQIKVASFLTIFFFGSLFVLDALSEFFSFIKWPNTWNTSNMQCYEEMFCEPTRTKMLVRRPGNTYSNCMYFFTSTCILLSVFNSSVMNPFWTSDVLFGILLMILAALSVIWHASNAPKSQYIDLWSMDSCICYLMLRLFGMTALVLIKAYPILASAVPHILLLSYISLIRKIGLIQYRNFKRGFLDAGCPFSTRALLEGVNRVNHHGTVNHYMLTTNFCIVIGMPIIYLLVPALLQYFILGGGSVMAATLCSMTLVIGWTYHKFERWFMDGLRPMIWIQSLRGWNETRRPVSSEGGDYDLVKMLLYRGISFCLTSAAALLSPTGWLHAFTGVTLLAAYINVRSIDQEHFAS